MARRPAAKPDPAKSVFVNCPFDTGFQPLLRAIAFTVVLCGYRPRCALDATDGAEVRIQKIAAMIGECDWGIHDLSRVEVTPGDLPRLNMPMELGIHLGARLLGERRHRRKKALILERERHRYDVALSDISGQDIEAHGNDPDAAIACVRNWLSENAPPGSPALPGPEALQADYRLFNAEVGALIARNRWDPLERLTHNDFLQAVFEWVSAHQATPAT